jgi:hypothetical protein
MRESIVVLSVLVEADRLIRSASDVTMQRIVMDYVFSSSSICFFFRSYTLTASCRHCRVKQVLIGI